MNSRSNTLTTPLKIEFYTGSKSSKGRELQVVFNNVFNNNNTPQVSYSNPTKGIDNMALTTTGKGIGDIDLTATNSYNIPDLQVVPANSTIAKNVPKNAPSKEPDKVKVTDMCR